MKHLTAADGTEDEPLLSTNPDDTGLPQQRVTRRPNSTKEQEKMAGRNTPSWYDMTQSELISQIQLWRARALQNRAELREAQASQERLSRAHKNACSEAKEYRHRARAAEAELKEVAEDDQH